MNLKNNNILNNNKSISDNEKNNFIESLKKFLDSDKNKIEILETGTIDRIEEDIAICEISDKQFIDIPLNKFNYSIQEKDVINLNLTYENGKVINIEVLDKNGSEKESREEIISEKFNKLRKK